MHIIKVKLATEGEFTFTFNETNGGKTSNTKLGLVFFISAMKKEFEKHPEPVSMTVMHENGGYFNPGVLPVYYIYDPKDWREVTIPLNAEAEKTLKDV